MSLAAAQADSPKNLQGLRIRIGGAGANRSGVGSVAVAVSGVGGIWFLRGYGVTSQEPGVLLGTVLGVCFTPGNFQFMAVLSEEEQKFVTAWISGWVSVQVWDRQFIRRDFQQCLHVVAHQFLTQLFVTTRYYVASVLPLLEATKHRHIPTPSPATWTWKRKQYCLKRDQASVWLRYLVISLLPRPDTTGATRPVSLPAKRCCACMASLQGNGSPVSVGSGTSRVLTYQQ